MIDKKEKVELKEHSNIEPYDIELINSVIKKRCVSNEINLKKMDVRERYLTINTIFKVFIATYGRQFADQYDNDFTKDIWFNALLIFSKEQIAEGIDLVLSDEYVTAPNLKRFMLYCGKSKADIKNNNNRLPRLIIGKNNY